MPIASHIDVDALNDVKLANDAIVLTSSSNAMHHYVSSNQSDKRWGHAMAEWYFSEFFQFSWSQKWSLRKIKAVTGKSEIYVF